MDRSSEFNTVFAALRMFERQNGKGSLLKQVDNKMSCDIIENLKKKLFTIDAINEQTQRRITLFLILQTDLIISRLLELDFGSGHLVRVLINGSLLVHIVWGLGLQKYYYETILYGPSALGEELTTLVVAASLNINDCIVAAGDLALTIFNKMWLMEQSVAALEQKYKTNIFNKYFAHFTTLLHSIVISESALPSISEGESNINRKRLQCILQLTRLCFTEPENVTRPPAEYKIDLKYDYSSWESDCDLSLLHFKHKITTECMVCVKNADISTLLWSQWFEIDSDVEGKSFQKFIGEEMYNCMLALEKNGLSESMELISILKMMSIKPETEDDEIERANLQTILENVFDKSKTHAKWLAALIKVETDEARFEECLSSIERSVPIEYAIINEVFDFVVRCLKDPNGSVYSQRLKHLVFKSLRTFSLNEQMEALKNYFDRNGATTLLKMDEFSEVFTEVFNKAVAISKNLTEEQLFAELINLCCQSPEDLLMKMLGEGISNENQTALMLKAFKILKPICELPIKGKEADKKEAGLLTQTIIKFLNQMELRDMEEANFVQLVTSLVKDSVIDRDIFLETCIAPTIRQCMLTHQWNIAILCLKIIEVTIKDVELNKLIPMVVMLSQVIYVSRCDLLNFTSNKSVVCDEACVIIKSIVPRLRNAGDLLEEGSIAWIEHKTFKLEGINKSYFYKLRPNIHNTKGNISAESVIIIGLQSGRIDSNILASAKDGLTEEVILHNLVKILPKLSSREWKSISCLKQLLIASDEDDGVFNLFNVLVDALMVINCIVKSQFTENQHALPCISFCIRNFALFVQDEVLTRPFSDAVEKSGGSAKNLQTTYLKAVFQKMLLLLETLPELIKESCSIFLMSLLKRIVSDVVLLESAGKEFCSEEIITEMCSLISLSSLRDVRVALAQDIAEVC